MLLSPDGYQQHVVALLEAQQQGQPRRAAEMMLRLTDDYPYNVIGANGVVHCGQPFENQSALANGEQ